MQRIARQRNLCRHCFSHIRTSQCILWSPECSVAQQTARLPANSSWGPPADIFDNRAVTQPRDVRSVSICIALHVDCLLSHSFKQATVCQSSNPLAEGFTVGHGPLCQESAYHSSLNPSFQKPFVVPCKQPTG